ncbi:uncharacterized protein I206_103983 [Kwoniella pini CBS 10737]|uniref:Myb-like domain-containing protein n=1 Tax=Kwoniella pini CBS 10737 TaxID=1296096 RepID=A0A1B9I2Z0_9TREE|nr:uncharacterized protein I206_04443 [Kwoniella pini CBS 10737]OCF49912.1 hypothetical protein I206_04443 [Kwoniella pini CBS 10737]
MPPKREYSSDSDAELKVNASSVKKISSPRKGWTPTEESAFINIIDEIVKNNLWSMVKDHPDLAGRQNGAVISHWNAMVKKLRKTS